MKYAKIDGSDTITQYPYDLQKLWVDNPNISFPATALTDATIRSTYNVVEVNEVVKPVKPGWWITEVTPIWDGAQWNQTWNTDVKLVAELNFEEYTKIEPVEKAGYKMIEGIPVLDGDEWKQTWTEVELTWRENRIIAYGSVEEQIEYITENGLEAWQDFVADIKAEYPAPPVG